MFKAFTLFNLLKVVIQKAQQRQQQILFGLFLPNHIVVFLQLYGLVSNHTVAFLLSYGLASNHIIVFHQPNELALSCIVAFLQLHRLDSNRIVAFAQLRDLSSILILCLKRGIFISLSLLFSLPQEKYCSPCCQNESAHK